MEQNRETRPGLNRRTFISLGAVAAAAALSPLRVQAASPGKKSVVRSLAFFNTHTGERLETMYCCDGKYEPQALHQINHILRDWRADKVKPIDPQLLDLLHELSGTLETDSPFHIISGYRSPVTNAGLREKDGAHTGVATQSLHMVGKAIDIRVPGVKLDHLRGAARSLKLGGVGFYPSSNFVHVDTGRVRFW